MEHYGQVNASSTIYIPFTTHAQSGAAVAPLTAYETADVLIYKDGSATQRTSANGLTMTSPFDSIVGLHLLAIDLSDNSDAGFYAAGSRYFVVLSADTETVDGLTVVRVLADFTIGPVAANATQLLGTAISTPATAGILDVNLKNIANATVSATTAQLGVNVVNNAGSAITSAAGIQEVKVASMAANAITATAIAADAITDAKVASDVTIASVTGAVGSVTGNVGGNVTGSVGSLAAQAKADVNAEVVDALNVDTYAESAAVPAATATLQAKVAWLATLARNKITQTATTQLVKADDGSTTVGTSTVSDDGTTATRGEFA